MWKNKSILKGKALVHILISPGKDKKKGVK